MDLANTLGNYLLIEILRNFKNPPDARLDCFLIVFKMTLQYDPPKRIEKQKNTFSLEIFHSITETILSPSLVSGYTSVPKL